MATAAIIAGAALSAVGSIQEGRAAESQANFQSDILKEQASTERFVSAQEEQDFRRRQSRNLSDARAAFGASGVDPGTGSPLDASSDFAKEVELRANRIRQGGAIRSKRMEQQSVLTRRAGRNARRRGVFRAGASLLSGFGEAFG